MGGVYPESVLFSEFNFNCGELLLGDTLECYASARDTVTLMPPEVKMVKHFAFCIVSFLLHFVIFVAEQLNTHLVYF